MRDSYESWCVRCGMVTEHAFGSCLWCRGSGGQGRDRLGHQRRPSHQEPARPYQPAASESPDDHFRIPGRFPTCKSAKGETLPSGQVVSPRQQPRSASQSRAPLPKGLGNSVRSCFATQASFADVAAQVHVGADSPYPRADASKRERCPDLLAGLLPRRAGVLDRSTNVS